MKIKGLLAGIVAAAIVVSLSTSVTLAANTDDALSVIPIEQNNLAPDINKSYFGVFTGKVIKMDSKFISLESEDGKEANFVVSDDTYILNGTEIVEGSVITGYYDANAPMIMIYPPQYKVEVIVVGKAELNVKVDVFDENLISSDNLLKLNISADTEIVLRDGTAYKGELTNRKLVVMYGISTKSIPAQTTPDKIVVLSEKAVKVDVSMMDIVVNDKKVEAPAAFISEDGTIMVPVRAISEALGYDVSWDGKLRSVSIGKGIQMVIGKDYYTYMKTAPIELGTAPEIVEGRTFVPLSFFTEVVRTQKAQVVDTKIEINE